MEPIRLVTSIVAVALFIAGIFIGSYIARDVDEALGTIYGGIWNTKAEVIWKQHERLFPKSRKRATLVAAFLASGAFFIITFFGL